MTAYGQAAPEAPDTPIRSARRWSAALLPTIVTYLLVGCGDGPAEPGSAETGDLQVSTSTIGQSLDPDGYSVVVDGGEGLAARTRHGYPGVDQGACAEAPAPSEPGHTVALRPAAVV